MSKPKYVIIPNPDPETEGKLKYVEIPNPQAPGMYNPGQVIIVQERYSKLRNFAAVLFIVLFPFQLFVNFMIIVMIIDIATSIARLSS